MVLGVATVYNGGYFMLKKDAGKVTDVHSRLNLDDFTRLRRA
jgi:hypothetical protein